MAKAGLMRDRATFQRMKNTTDVYGNVTEADWIDIAVRSVELVEKTGFEDDNLGAVQDVARALLKVRADTDTKGVTVADRVTVRNTTWAIRSVSS